MPNVTGKVIYDQAREFTSTTGIASVPVCLFNATSGNGITALTDANGNFTFTNVPAGNYQLIECWGTSGTTTPVSFSSATSINKPSAADPPITAVPSPITGANKLDSLTPNTLFVTIAASDVTNNLFYDGPITNSPIFLGGAQVVGNNLITAANNGNWGTLPAGSPFNTIPPTNPYPGTLNGLSYMPSYPPTNAMVTVDNITNGYTDWWQLANHTDGMETGRMLIVNGANPGAMFFKDTVTVTANTNYLLTTWITNMNNPNHIPGLSSPQMGIKATAPDGTVLYNQILSQVPNANPPKWAEIGGILNSGAYTSFTIELTTQNPDPSGNDFAIDDIQLREVKLINPLQVTKSASPSPTTLGATITYTVTITNVTTDVPSRNVFFKDTLSSANTFIGGSVKVNGSSTGFQTADPNVGFSIGTIAAGQSKVVTFDAKVTSSTPNPIPNQAIVSYLQLETNTGDSITSTVPSNTVNTPLVVCDLSQAAIDLMASVAAQERAIAHIINAEGEKIQKAISLNATPDQLLAINASVKKMIRSLEGLEAVLENKLSIIECQIDC